MFTGLNFSKKSGRWTRCIRTCTFFYPVFTTPKPGGFYESVPKEGKPRIESTARGITMLEKADMLDAIPATMRQKFIIFFQMHQDAASGFFEDPQEQRSAYERRGRALSYSVGALEKLGATPLYPLPGKKSDQTEMAHLQSVPDFRAWLDDLPWERSWSAGSILSAQSALISQLPEPLHSTIVDFLFAYLEERQHPSTGMWGTGSPYVQISGAFKVSMMYQTFGRLMPRADCIYRSLIKCMRKEVCWDATWVRNPLHLLRVIQPQLEALPDTERQEIVRIAIYNISQFLRPDGGFARNLEQNYGVTDGCSQAMKTRDALRELIGLVEEPFPAGRNFLQF